MTTRILTDSTCDLPADLVDEYGITVVPAYVNIGTRSLRDGVDLSREAFYDDLPTFEPYPTTAAPSPGEFAEQFSRLQKEGAAELMAIHVAGSLSGILNASRSGAELAGVQVTFIDSGQLTMGLGFQVLAAGRLAKMGASAAEITAAVENLQNKTYVYALIDSLDGLRRGGRVSWLVQQVGTLLQIKLILEVHQGQIAPIRRIRSRQKALAQLADIGRSLGPLTELAFLNTNALDMGEFKARVAPFLPDSLTPMEAVACPAIGVHVGPQAVAFACVTA